MATKLKRDINDPIELEVLKQNAQLGNVPNVTTNDQTPTWSASSVLTNIISGEKLTIIMGKISKAISDIISHISNKNNPHNINKTQIGLENVENKSSSTIRGELTKENVTSALGYIPPATDTKYGVATNSQLGLVKSGTDISVDLNGNVNVNRAKKVSADNSVTICPEYNSEINFGGNVSTSKIYFGYREKDNKPIPDSFVFGGSTGTSTIKAKKFDGNVNEANLSWGGKNFSGNFGCIDGAMIQELGANRLQFLNPNGITIEYSRDNGDTWVDYELSDYQKKSIFSNNEYGVVIGNSSTSDELNSSYKTRITINTDKARIYTILNKFCIYISTKGSDGCTVTIERALELTPTQFEKIATDIPISGWSGYNIINIPETVTYGNTPEVQYGRLRFIFSIKSHESSYQGLTIYNIKGFGGTGWTVPSTMAKTGHLYDFDANQNAIFPNTIKAPVFIGKIQDSNISSRNISISYSGADITNPNYFAVWSTDGNEIRTLSTNSVKNIIGIDNYLPLNGGIMQGAIKFPNSIALPNHDNLQYICGITAFSEGGTLGWSSANNIKVGYADIAGSAKASDVYSWAKQPNKPIYSYNELEDKPIIPSGVQVENNLNSTSATSSLSANQGRILKECIDKKIIVSKTQPKEQQIGDTWYEII